ncbi:MAG: response regulator [Candidatus Limivivens sp.]|nr:response regulator [Candidatus Limivivens sp.]
MDIQLLIVDDEKLTKDGLTNYIDWSAFGITQVRSASNGLEALEIVRGFSPDILLTDVKMPHMDGITLARRIRELYPSCKLLFLSGYADKEYLKSAIDLKAETYIEKPVILNNVALTVSKVIQLVKSEKQASERSALLDASLTEARKIVHIDIVQDLVSPNPDWEAFKKKYVPTYFTWQDNSSYAVACIAIHSCMDFRTGKQTCHALNQFLLDKRIFSDHEFFIGLLENNRPILITSVTYSAVLHGILNQVRDYLKTDQNLDSTIAIGPTVHKLADIRESYLIAAGNLEYQHMYYNYQSILDCHFALKEKPSPEDLFSRHTWSLASTEQLFAVLKAEQYTDIARIKTKLYELYIATCTGVPLSWEEFQLYTLQDYAQIICYGMSSLEDLNHLDQYHKQIQKAIRFMLLNYMHSDLNIRSIAEEAGLSQNYFCSLFKQNTGITANDYLLNIRMEKVCFYLKHSELKLYEIADKVGIPDSNYLNTLFKKRFNQTPTQYRREHQ